jgi:phosphatidate cytidylyltransferase
MAFNLQNFKTRTLTAVFFAAIMLAGIFINVYVFMALFTLVAVGCIMEYAKIIRQIDYDKRFSHLPFLLIYILAPIFMLVSLGVKNEQDTIYLDPLFPAAIIFSIWINDTMAYLVGSVIGKTPFSKISPKKTWEGTIGGAILCIILITLLFHATSLFSNELSILNWIIIASLCAVFGTLGDLFESKLKRMAGIKDSGKIMPGHGGFLDRFDSLLFAAPAVWVYVKYFIS